jgi:diguanylate cyclase (GGDEF)-like protein
MTGLLPAESFERVFNAWRRALRTDPLLSRLAMPDLRPFSEAFNDVLTGEETGELDVACADLVRQDLDPGTVIRITTILAETFTDEVGTQSGAVTKSLVSTLGHVCGLLTTTMVHDVEESARRDALTGLENRIAWDAALADQLGYGELTLVIIDLDGLKRVNDEEGHLAGDEYLRKFAADLRAAIPDGARAYRFGGDEYSVIMPHGSVSATESVLEDLAGIDGVAPFSYGTATSPREGRDAETLKRLADERMYAMKRERKGTRDRSGAEPAPVAVSASEVSNSRVGGDEPGSAAD